MMYFAAGLPRRIATLGERAQARLEGSQQRSENGGEGESLDEASLKRLLSLLKQQQASLAALEVCRQTPLDFGITRIYRPNRVAVQKPDRPPLVLSAPPEARPAWYLLWIRPDTYAEAHLECQLRVPTYPYGVLQGVLQADNRDLAIMLENGGDVVPMAVITV